MLIVATDDCLEVSSMRGGGLVQTHTDVFGKPFGIKSDSHPFRIDRVPKITEEYVKRRRKLKLPLKPCLDTTTQRIWRSNNKPTFPTVTPSPIS
mgnify:CR=1 FL=1